MTKSALIIGGSAGVGRAVLDSLLGRGFRVGIVARGTDRLDALAAEFEGRVSVAPADVAKWEELDIATAKIVEDIGAPEVWVNCAMATAFSPFAEVAPEEFQRIVDVTLMGQVNGTRAALKHMDKGHIVCVGSGLAYRSVPNQAAYCAAKHGINGFVSAVRSELLRDKSGVSLHLVQLPAVNTPQFDWALNRMDQKPQPAPPIFQPSVAAEAVMKAVDTDAREILVGKSVLQLIFGNFVLPDYLDRKLAKSGVKMQKSDRPDTDERSNLFEPVDYPPSAEGSYTDRASDSGLIIDGDLARKLVFFGGGLLIFIIGLLLG